MVEVEVTVAVTVAVAVEHIHACIERSTIGSEEGCCEAMFDKNAIDSTAFVRLPECARLCKAPKSIVALGRMHLRWQPMRCVCDYSDRTRKRTKNFKCPAIISHCIRLESS